MTAAEAQIRGTYRPDRHGPLDPGTRILRMPPLPAAQTMGPSLTYLDADDCPPVLATEGQAFWLTLITTRPTPKIYAQLVTCYVEAWLQWCRATRAIAKIGDLVSLKGKPEANPYLKLRTDAERTLFECAKFLGWQPAVAKADLKPPDEVLPPKLAAFLAAKKRAR